MVPLILRFCKNTLKKIYFQYQLNIKAGEPVIVYQMGKVGSSSIYQSLKKQIKHPVFHVHRMNLKNINDVAKEYKNAKKVPPDETSGLFLNKHVINKSQTVKIISLVREPIERNISAFFQNYERFVGSKYKKYDILEIENLIDNFWGSYNHEVPLKWFDVEIKNVVGIDVYKYPFPFDKGYIIIQEPPYELLIIKLETEDRVKEDAIKKFLDLDDFKLYSHNVGQKKEYALTYNDFKQKISVPADYINKMCDSKYTRHFYNSEEMGNIRKKWT